MNMTGYTKLFQEIIGSSIWDEDDTTRIVWITMLALKNGRHVVNVTMKSLAMFSRVSVEACGAAIAKLEAPDKESRSAEFEGRRIRAIESGGWLVLNGEKYSKMFSQDETRKYYAEKQSEYRARVKAGKSATSGQQGQGGPTGENNGHHQELIDILNKIQGRPNGSELNLRESQALGEINNRAGAVREAQQILAYRRNYPADKIEFFPAMQGLLEKWTSILDRARADAASGEPERPKPDPNSWNFGPVSFPYDGPGPQRSNWPEAKGFDGSYETAKVAFETAKYKRNVKLIAAQKRTNTTPPQQ